MQEKEKKVNSAKSDGKSRARASVAEPKLPITDEIPVEPSPAPAKKSRAKKSAPTHIVTKTGELDDTVRPYVSATIDKTVVDASVFDDDVTDEPISGYYQKSTTIDGTMLSREQATVKNKRKRAKNKKTVDLTLAERYDPAPDAG